MDKTDIWSKLAASLPAGVISWRQDGKPTHRDGKYFARFVAYIEANTVRERLDSVVPGEWDLTLELLPQIPGMDDDASACSFKARLQILGVIREDVGTGKDYKQAATDAFKRAAVRFGIGHELYAYEQNWVQVDGDGKYAKPVEDPQSAYLRRYGTEPTPKQERAAAAAAGRESTNGVSKRRAVRVAEDLAEVTDEPAGTPVGAAIADDVMPSCPKCSGKMWDNRATKRNPKAPDFKCRDRTCDGVIWPPKGAAAGRSASAPSAATVRADEPEMQLDTSPLGNGMDDIPF
jgi:hypothetical protein